MSEGGKWAIITGASSGIGRALAFEFAKNGYNIFLTARDEQRLAEISREAQQKFNVEAEVFLSDLADSDSTDPVRSDSDTTDGCDSD